MLPRVLDRCASLQIAEDVFLEEWLSSFPCAEDGHSVAVGMHNFDLNVRLAIEIAFIGVLSVETIFFTKVLCISTALL